MSWSLLWECFWSTEWRKKKRKKAISLIWKVVQHFIAMFVSIKKHVAMWNFLSLVSVHLSSVYTAIRNQKGMLCVIMLFYYLMCRGGMVLSAINFEDRWWLSIICEEENKDSKTLTGACKWLNESLNSMSVKGHVNLDAAKYSSDFDQNYWRRLIRRKQSGCETTVTSSPVSLKKEWIHR